VLHVWDAVSLHFNEQRRGLVSAALHPGVSFRMPKNSAENDVSASSALEVYPRLPLTSEDPLAIGREELKRLFPSAVSEGKIDFEKLRGLLAPESATGPERYGLSWAGKKDALKVLRSLTTATLLPAPSESVNWENTSNAIIEGDNLEVLKTLQHAYHGKVKLIYIDPPYNTGGDFIYPDDYAEGLASYQLFTRQVNAEGHKLTTNVNTSGRYHSRWLTMIYPRLSLARNLLREDGVIFVSIDDHEVHNLRLVMDEIFGEENFVAQVVWQKKYAVSNDDPGIGVMHDYVLVYRRSDKFKRGFLPRTEKQLVRYTNADNDSRGAWSSDNYVSNKSREERPTLWYPIKHPKTGEDVWPEEHAVWRYAVDTHERMVAENRLYWGPNQSYQKPRLKRFLNEIQEGVVPSTWWEFEDTGHNDEASKETGDILGRKVFDTPKPVRLLRKIITIGAGKNDLILDFFSGSGTTAQAVLELNKEDGGSRKFILVQLPEPTGRKDFPTIAEITKERVRRVIQRMKNEDADKLGFGKGATEPDLGFKVFKLAPSNFAIWDPALAPEDPEKLAEQWKLTADNVRPVAFEEALLYELMLKCSLPLDSHFEKADASGCSVYRLDEGKLLICLAREITHHAVRAMIAFQPQSILCLDIGFKGNDSLKVNAQLECQSHGIQFRTA